VRESVWDAWRRLEAGDGLIAGNHVAALRLNGLAPVNGTNILLALMVLFRLNGLTDIIPGDLAGATFERVPFDTGGWWRASTDYICPLLTYTYSQYPKLSDLTFVNSKLS
jgi:hypothetical protein